MQNQMPSICFLIQRYFSYVNLQKKKKKKQEKTRGIFLKIIFPPPQKYNNFSSNQRGWPQNSAINSFYFPPSKTVSPSFGHKAGEAVLAHKTPAEATLTGHSQGQDCLQDLSEPQPHSAAGMGNTDSCQQHFWCYSACLIHQIIRSPSLCFSPSWCFANFSLSWPDPAVSSNSLCLV